MGRKREDLTGKRFGQVVVLRDAPDSYWNGNARRRVVIRCDCGVEKVADPAILKTGRQKSCGCFSRSGATFGRPLFGVSKRPEYSQWRGMIGRCHNPNHSSYCHYGERGVEVCEEWRTADGFLAFIKHIGERPGPEYTIDRIDNARGYEPGNVRWATRRVQSANRKSSISVTVNGDVKSLPQICEEQGLRYWNVLRGIRHYGLTVQDSIEVEKTKLQKRRDAIATMVAEAQRVGLV